MVFLVFRKTNFLLHFRVKKTRKKGQKFNFRRFWWNLHTNRFWPRKWVTLLGLSKGLSRTLFCMAFLIFQKTHFLLHFRVKKVEKIGQKLNFRRFWWNLHTNRFWPRSFTWWGSFCVETTFYGVFGVLKLICQSLRNRPKIAFFDWFSSDSRLKRFSCFSPTI